MEEAGRTILFWSWFASHLWPGPVPALGTAAPAPQEAGRKCGSTCKCTTDSNACLIQSARGMWRP